MAGNCKLEMAPSGLWHIKEVDGYLFAKVKEARIKNSAGHLMEEIVNVSAHRNGKYVSITFKDILSVTGKWTLMFTISAFEPVNDISRQLQSPNEKSSEFESAWRRWKMINNLQSIPETPALPAIVHQRYEDDEDNLNNSVVGPSADVNATSSGKSRKEEKRGLKKVSKRNTEEEELELKSPEKRAKKASNIDEEIAAHHIGLFSIDVGKLKNPPEQWLDRPLNDQQVNKLFECLKETPTTFLHDHQPWVGIADISRDVAIKNKNLLKGCNITVVGGLHRKAAFEKLCATSEKHKPLLKQVYVSVYGNTLTTEQIKRVAASHNLENKGSKATSWMQRVVACRKWRYQMEDLDPNGPTPPTTTEWRDSCKRMYVEAGKSPTTLEPTLQAALLEKPAWDLFVAIGRKYDLGELKDMPKKTKPSRIRKINEITQNQLGMPLQGICLQSKIDLLRAVVNEEISLKEMAAKASRIKSKHVIIDAFLKHTGIETWDELKQEFPKHTTEDQISQFVHLKLRPHNIPQELKQFFQRAISWRENKNKRKNQSESVQEENDYFQFCDGEAIAVAGSLYEPGVAALKTSPSFSLWKGMELVIASLPDGLSTEVFRLFIINVHAVNIDSMEHYNVVFICEGGMEQALMLSTVLEDKMTGVQQLFWNNTRNVPLTGRLIPNALTPILVGHWSSSGALVHGSCHFETSEVVTNVFDAASTCPDQVPVKLMEDIISHFSYPEEWVYGVNVIPGNLVIASLNTGRKCICASGDARAAAGAIQKALQTAAEVENPTQDEEDNEENEENEEETEASVSIL